MAKKGFLKIFLGKISDFEKNLHVTELDCLREQNKHLKTENARLRIENEHLINLNEQLQKNLDECLEEMPK